MTKKPTNSERKFDTLYVVTGISRLTGEREACSIPVHKPMANLLYERWKSKPARKRDYLRLKLESYNPCISFKNKE